MSSKEKQLQEKFMKALESFDLNNIDANSDEAQELKNLCQNIIDEAFGTNTLWEAEVEKELQNSSPKTTENEIAQEISEYYNTLITAFCPKYDNVRLNYNNVRAVIIDEKEYNFDDLICHDDAELTECLMAIDAIASLDSLTKAEQILNNKR